MISVKKKIGTFDSLVAKKSLKKKHFLKFYYYFSSYVWQGVGLISIAD